MVGLGRRLVSKESRWEPTSSPDNRDCECSLIAPPPPPHSLESCPYQLSLVPSLLDTRSSGLDPLANAVSVGFSVRFTIIMTIPTTGVTVTKHEQAPRANSVTMHCVAHALPRQQCQDTSST